MAKPPIPPLKTPKDLLVDALDTAATQILQRAMHDGTVPPGEPPPVVEPPVVSLTEQIKAFEAVVGWVSERDKVAPPEKEKSGFHAIREQFDNRNSPAPRRRGAAAAPEEDADPDA